MAWIMLVAYANTRHEMDGARYGESTRDGISLVNKKETTQAGLNQHT